MECHTIIDDSTIYEILPRHALLKLLQSKSLYENSNFSDLFDNIALQIILEY